MSAKRKQSNEQTEKMLQELFKLVSTPAPAKTEAAPPAPALADEFFQKPVKVAMSAAANNAQRLHNFGFSVFPIPYGTKGKEGMLSWKAFQRRRLRLDDIPHAFHGRCNIAVVCGFAGLFVIDCESQDALHHHAHEMKARNLPVYAIKTARGGHIYARVEGVPLSIPQGEMMHAEIRGAGAYVVGEGSMHPSGAQYDVHPLSNTDAPPLVEAAAINWLKDKAGAPLRLVVQRKRARVDAYRAYLDNGHAIAEGARNESLFRAAVSARQAGIGETTAAASLTTPALASGLSAEEVQATIASAYRGQVTQGQRARKIEHLCSVAGAYPWQARTRDTDRRVWLALVERYRQDALGRPEFHASTRTLADIAGISHPAAIRALQRMTTAYGLLERAAYGSKRSATATEYRFTARAWDKNLGHPVTTRTKSYKTACSGNTVSQTPIAEKSALGLTGALIYDTLLRARAALTVQELAQAIGAIVRTVYRALKPQAPLIRFGLVVMHDGRPARYSAIPHTQRQLHEAVIVPTDTDMKIAARAARHEEERAAHLLGLVVHWRLNHDAANYWFTDAQPDKATP